MGLSENVGYIPNEIAIFHRDNDQQNHWVNGVLTIFRHTHVVTPFCIYREMGPPRSNSTWPRYTALPAPCHGPTVVPSAAGCLRLASGPAVSCRWGGSYNF